MAVGAAVGLWRGAGVSLVLDQTGATVRNPFRTYQLPWSDISAFGVRFGGWSHECVGVKRRDGRETAVVALPLWDPARQRGRASRRMLEQLSVFAHAHGKPADFGG